MATLWKNRLRRGTKVKFEFPTEGTIVNATGGGWKAYKNPNAPINGYRISVQTDKGPVWIHLPVECVKEIT